MKNRIRVVCDDGFRVQITDAQTGAVIPGVCNVTFNGRAGDLSTVTLECLCSGVDVIGELEAIEFVSIPRGDRRRFELPVGTREVPVDQQGDYIDPEDVTNQGERFMQKRATGGAA